MYREEGMILSKMQKIAQRREKHQRDELRGNFRESLDRVREGLSTSTSVSKGKARAETQKAQRTFASS